MAVIVIFVVLSALYESFRGPVIILIVLPTFYTFLATDRTAGGASGAEGTATQRA